MVKQRVLRATRAWKGGASSCRHLGFLLRELEQRAEDRRGVAGDAIVNLGGGGADSEDVEERQAEAVEGAVGEGGLAAVAGQGLNDSHLRFVCSCAAGDALAAGAVDGSDRRENFLDYAAAGAGEGVDDVAAELDD